MCLALRARIVLIIPMTESENYLPWGLLLLVPPTLVLKKFPPMRFASILISFCSAGFVSL